MCVIICMKAVCLPLTSFFVVFLSNLPQSRWLLSQMLSAGNSKREREERGLSGKSPLGHEAHLEGNMVVREMALPK